MNVRSIEGRVERSDTRPKKKREEKKKGGGSAAEERQRAGIGAGQLLGPTSGATWSAEGGKLEKVFRQVLAGFRKIQAGQPIGWCLV